MQRTIFPGWFTSSCKPNEKEKEKKRKERKGTREIGSCITALRISQAGQLSLSIPETNCNFILFFFFVGWFTSSHKPSKERERKKGTK